MVSAALNCLFYPFSNGEIERPAPGDRVLFLCAEVPPDASMLPPDTVYQQHSRPLHDRIKDAGGRVMPEIPSPERDFNYVLLLAPGQAEETRFRIAQGVKKIADGGLVVCSATNDAGGNRLAKLFKELGLTPNVESKHKAKVVWSRISRDNINATVMEEFLGHGRLRVSSHGLLSCPGIFGWDKIDRGSEMLASHFPALLHGKGADFGCGYGYLSCKLLGRERGIEKLYCVDADYRALEACRKNIAGIAAEVDTEFMWEDLSSQRPPISGLDWVVMNPPFHSAGRESFDLGISCIRCAAAALKNGGELLMVANTHLPYERVLKSHFSSFHSLEEHSGFKVVRARK